MLGVINLSVTKSSEYPKIESMNKKVITDETAYQMTSILQGAVGVQQKN